MSLMLDYTLIKTDGDSLEFACSFLHMIDDNLKLLLGVYQKELSLWMANFSGFGHICENEVILCRYYIVDIS